MADLSRIYETIIGKDCLKENAFFCLSNYLYAEMSFSILTTTSLAARNVAPSLVGPVLWITFVRSRYRCCWTLWPSSVCCEQPPGRPRRGVAYPRTGMVKYSNLSLYTRRSSLIILNFRRVEPTLPLALNICLIVTSVPLSLVILYTDWFQKLPYPAPDHVATHVRELPVLATSIIICAQSQRAVN